MQIDGDKMNKFLVESTKRELNDLISYVSTCKLDEKILYTKTANTFSHLGALFNNFIKEPQNENDKLKNACVAFNNAFKHCSELGEDYSDLNMIEYGTAFNCILNAPFGDVVFFRNAEYLNELKDNRNYKWYSKVFEGKRMDIILNNIKKMVGEEYD